MSRSHWLTTLRNCFQTVVSGSSKGKRRRTFAEFPAVAAQVLESRQLLSGVVASAAASTDSKQTVVDTGSPSTPATTQNETPQPSPAAPSSTPDATQKAPTSPAESPSQKNQSGKDATQKPAVVWNLELTAPKSSAGTTNVKGSP